MKIDLTFWLIIALITSGIGNILLFYYSRVLLGKLLYLGDNLSDFEKRGTHDPHLEDSLPEGV